MCRFIHSYFPTHTNETVYDTRLLDPSKVTPEPVDRPQHYRTIWKSSILRCAEGPVGGAVPEVPHSLERRMWASGVAELRLSVQSPRIGPQTLGLSGGATLLCQSLTLGAGQRHPAFLGDSGRTPCSAPLLICLPTCSVCCRS